MLHDEDLAEAVKAGVITAEQQSALEKQAAARRAASALDGGDDERFRFMLGFNDVFLTVGVLLVTGAFLSQWRPQQNSGGVFLLIGVAVLWGISEVLVARHKAVLPGIAAVLCIGLLCGLAAAQWATVAGLDRVMHVPGDATVQARMWDFPFGIWFASVGAGCLATLAYYVRFRLPFALLPLAVGIISTALLGIVYVFGLRISVSALNVAALVLGFATFALAMRFDTTDPQRQTRRADCGFWLHLAAAPFIVHPVIATLVTLNSLSGAMITIGVVVALGVVALIIDRRALLVSSLTYFGLAVGYLVSHGTGGPETSITLTLALLGAFVILMGLGWHHLRRLILSPFRGGGWLRLLPPVQA
jgi:hypothetical protein